MTDIEEAIERLEHELLINADESSSGFYRDIQALINAVNDGWVKDSDELWVEIEKKDKVIEAVRDFLSGNYKCPKYYRPNQCPHNSYYYEECALCDEEHFIDALASLEQDNE